MRAGSKDRAPAACVPQHVIAQDPTGVTFCRDVIRRQDDCCRTSKPIAKRSLQPSSGSSLAAILPPYFNGANNDYSNTTVTLYTWHVDDGSFGATLADHTRRAGRAVCIYYK